MAALEQKQDKTKHFFLRRKDILFNMMTEIITQDLWNSNNVKYLS